MANRKLPLDAFKHYVALGTNRSYQAVADHYGVSKQTVVTHAKRENWQAQLQHLEIEARERAREEAAEALDAVRARQLKSVRLLQARALQALQNQPPEKGVRAAAALAIAWKHELFLLGEATERTEVDVWEKIQHEQRSWLVPIEADEEGETAEGAAEEEGARGGEAG